MHLTHVLSFFKRYPKIPGKLRAGKYRMNPVIHPKQKAAALKSLLVEETNVNLLQNPYISIEEEKGSMKALGNRKEKWLAMIQEKKEKSWKKDTSVVEHLDHLNTTKAWE